MLGVKWEAPLAHLREYIHILKTLLQTGAIEYEGQWFTARARIEAPVEVPILAATLRKTAYHLAGELADGAISWLTPVEHIRLMSLQALRAGAAKAGRAPPPLVLHAPFCLTDDVEVVRQATRKQFGSSARRSTYAGLFEEAGYPNVKGEMSDELIDNLVIYGTQSDVVHRLSKLVGDGVSEVIAHALPTGDLDESAVFAMIAEANQPRQQRRSLRQCQKKDGKPDERHSSRLR
ncbi:MAG: LLM class flavin-dependent oxidoreductase [Dehalococcoidia bacterium]|nr:LLM class flavin-dependent oxidoreductase [Dehalococcoidia bacterium]